VRLGAFDVAHVTNRACVVCVCVFSVCVVSVCETRLI